MIDEPARTEDAWEALAEQRYQRYLAGEEEAVPVAQALDEIRDELGL